MSIDNSFYIPPSEAPDDAARKAPDANVGKNLYADPAAFQKAHLEATSAMKNGSGSQYLPDFNLAPDRPPADHASPPVSAGASPEKPSADKSQPRPIDQSSPGVPMQHGVEQTAAASTTPRPGEQTATASTTPRPGEQTAAASTTPRPGEQTAAASTTPRPGEQTATASTTPRPGEQTAAASTTSRPGDQAATASTTRPTGDQTTASSTARRATNFGVANDNAAGQATPPGGAGTTIEHIPAPAHSGSAQATDRPGVGNTIGTAEAGRPTSSSGGHDGIGQAATDSHPQTPADTPQVPARTIERAGTGSPPEPSPPQSNADRAPVASNGARLAGAIIDGQPSMQPTGTSDQPAIVSAAAKNRPTGLTPDGPVPAARGAATDTPAPSTQGQAETRHGALNLEANDVQPRQRARGSGLGQAGVFPAESAEIMGSAGRGGQGQPAADEAIPVAPNSQSRSFAPSPAPAPAQRAEALPSGNGTPEAAQNSISTSSSARMDTVHPSDLAPGVGSALLPPTEATSRPGQTAIPSPATDLTPFSPATAHPVSTEVTYRPGQTVLSGTESHAPLSAIVDTPAAAIPLAKPTPPATPTREGEPGQIALPPSALATATGTSRPPVISEPNVNVPKDQPVLAQGLSAAQRSPSDLSRAQTAPVEAHASLSSSAQPIQPASTIEAPPANQPLTVGKELSQTWKSGEHSGQAAPQAEPERAKTEDPAIPSTRAPEHPTAETPKPVAAVPEATRAVPTESRSEPGKNAAETFAAASTVAYEVAAKPPVQGEARSETAPTAKVIEGSRNPAGVGASADVESHASVASIQPNTVNVAANGDALKKSKLAATELPRAPQIVGPGISSTALSASDRPAVQVNTPPKFASLARSSLSHDTSPTESKGQPLQVSALPPDAKATGARAGEMPLNAHVQTIGGERNANAFSAVPFALPVRGDLLSTPQTLPGRLQESIIGPAHQLDGRVNAHLAGANEFDTRIAPPLAGNTPVNAKQMIQIERDLLPPFAVDKQSSSKAINQFQNAMQAGYLDAAASRRAETPVFNPIGVPANGHLEVNAFGAKSSAETGRPAAREVPVHGGEIKKSIVKPETSLDNTNVQPVSTNKNGLPSLTASAPGNTKQVGPNAPANDPNSMQATGGVPISVTSAIAGLPTVSIQQDPSAFGVNGAPASNQLLPDPGPLSVPGNAGIVSHAATAQHLPTITQTVGPANINSLVVNIPSENSANSSESAIFGSPQGIAFSTNVGPGVTVTETINAGQGGNPQLSMTGSLNLGQISIPAFDLNLGSGLGISLPGNLTGSGHGSAAGSGSNSTSGPAHGIGITFGIGTGSGSGLGFGIGVDIGTGKGGGIDIQAGIGLGSNNGVNPGVGLGIGIAIGSGGGIAVGLGLGTGSGVQLGAGTGSGTSSGGVAGSEPGAGSVVGIGLPGNSGGADGNPGGTFTSPPLTNDGSSVPPPFSSPSGSSIAPEAPGNAGDTLGNPTYTSPPDLVNPSGGSNGSDNSNGNGGTIDSPTYSPLPDGANPLGSPQGQSPASSMNGNGALPDPGYPSDPSLPSDLGSPPSSAVNPGDMNGGLPNNAPNNPLMGSVQYSDGFDYQPGGANSGGAQTQTDQSSNSSLDPNQPFSQLDFSEANPVDLSWSAPDAGSSSMTSTLLADSGVALNPDTTLGQTAGDFAQDDIQGASPGTTDLINFADSQSDVVNVNAFAEFANPPAVNVTDSGSHSPQIDNQIAFSGALDGVPMLQGEGSILPNFDNGTNPLADAAGNLATADNASGSVTGDATDLVNFDGSGITSSQGVYDPFGSTDLAQFAANEPENPPDAPTIANGAGSDGFMPDNNLPDNYAGGWSPWSSDQSKWTQNDFGPEDNIRDDQSLLLANGDSGEYRPEFDQTEELADGAGFNGFDDGGSGGLETARIPNAKFENSDREEQSAGNLATHRIEPPEPDRDLATDLKAHNRADDVDQERGRMEDQEKRDREAAEAHRLAAEKQVQLAQRQELDDDAQKLVALLIAEEDKLKQDNKQQQYKVRRGDTLEQIALLKLRDARLAHLIYQLNKTKITLEYATSKPVYKLQENSIIWLPSPRQVREWKQQQAFNSLLKDSPAAKKLSQQNRKEAAQRRSNVEKYLGALAQVANEASHCKVNVRLGDTLRSIASNHPILRDVSLWRLLAEINGLSTDVDLKGTPIAQIRRGTSLLLPTAEEIDEFKKRTHVSTRPSARVPQSSATTQMTVITGNKGQPAFQLRAENLDHIEQKWVRDTILNSLVEKLGDSCRIVKSTGNGGSTHLMRSQLEVLTGNTWVPILTYEISQSNSVRFELDEDGNRIIIPIDLPARTVEEMMSNDMHDNWQTYAGNYLRRKV